MSSMLLQSPARRTAPPNYALASDCPPGMFPAPADESPARFARFGAPPALAELEAIPETSRQLLRMLLPIFEDLGGGGREGELKAEEILRDWLRRQRNPGAIGLRAPTYVPYQWDAAEIACMHDVLSAIRTTFRGGDIFRALRERIAGAHRRAVMERDGSAAATAVIAQWQAIEQFVSQYCVGGRLVASEHSPVMVG